MFQIYKIYYKNTKIKPQLYLQFTYLFLTWYPKKVKMTAAVNYKKQVYMEKRKTEEEILKVSNYVENLHICTICSPIIPRLIWKWFPSDGKSWDYYM